MAKIDKIQEVDIEKLRPYERNAKTHDAEQVQKIADSINEFGFISPCLIDKDFNIIAGHGRVMAAKELNLKTVPCVFVEGLTEVQRKAYILADNKLTELGGWDMALVNDELEALAEMNFDIDLTGFELKIDEIADDVERDDLSEKVESVYEVIVECVNEAEQESVFNQLTNEGRSCRVLTL